jgi:adenylate kinase
MTKPDIIFMMGPSGVGKGTQSQFLQEKYGYFHWENGAILRSMGNYKLKNGAILSEFIADGNFLPEEDIMDIVWAKIAEIPEGTQVIFDGIPRTLYQAQRMTQSFRDKGKKIATIYLDAHDEELVRRLLERAKTQGRADDHLEAITKRLAQFRELTAPALEYLRKETEFHDIDSRPPIPEVAEAIERKLGLHA